MGGPQDDLYQLLEECLERYLGGESVEKCAGRYPTYAEEIRAYLAVAQELSPVSDYQPSEEAKEHGRQRLLAEWEAIKNRRVQSEEP